MTITDKRVPFVLSKSVLGYDICEIDITDINVYENIIEEIVCVGSTIYNNLSDIYDRLLSLCEQWGDNDCITYLSSIKNQNSLSCLNIPSGFVTPNYTFNKLNGGDIKFTINNNNSPYRFIIIEEYYTNIFGNRILTIRTQGTQEIIFSPKIFINDTNYKIRIRFLKTFIPFGEIEQNIIPKPPFLDIEISGSNVILFPREDIIYTPNSIKYRVKDNLNNTIIPDTYYENTSSFTKTPGKTYTVTLYYVSNTLLQSQITIN
jgi:hypothetical protein